MTGNIAFGSQFSIDNTNSNSIAKCLNQKDMSQQVIIYLQRFGIEINTIYKDELSENYFVQDSNLNWHLVLIKNGIITGMEDIQV